MAICGKCQSNLGYEGRLAAAVMLLNSEGTLRIFTPSSELPFAGHPTIGTFHTITEEDSFLRIGYQVWFAGIRDWHCTYRS